MPQFPDRVVGLRRGTARLAVASALALAAFATEAQTSPAVAIQVGEQTVTVSNVTPGGAVVLFTCARTSRQGRTHVQRRAVTLRDEDGDGTIQFTPDGGVPLRSVWTATDFTSGATVAGAHPRFPLVVNELAASSFKKDAEGAIGRLERQIRRLLILVVRPGTGAWMLFARDGAEGDADLMENARVSLDFAAARPIEGKTAAPRHLKADDVVVAIDPNHLDVHLARIAR